jgi:hypothetical protein
MRKYTIEVNIPTLRVIGDDKQTYTFSLMTKQQVLNEWNVEVNENDEIYNNCKKGRLFPTESQIRENKLNEIGI